MLQSRRRSILIGTSLAGALGFAGLARLSGLIAPRESRPAGDGPPLVFSRLPGDRGLVVPAAGGRSVPAYRKGHAANPSGFVRDGTVHLYFRADPRVAGGRTDQSLALFTQPVAGFRPEGPWTDEGVVIRPDQAGPGSESGIWDPCVVAWRGRVWAFWAARGAAGLPGTDRLGSAVSEDGRTFAVGAVNPQFSWIATAGLIPTEEQLYIVYNVRDGADGGFGTHIASTTDGITWTAPDAVVPQADDGAVLAAQPGKRIFAPTQGDPQDFERNNLAPLRGFAEDDRVYVVYGCNHSLQSLDWPEGAGIRYAVDPLNGRWERLERPIALRGPIGAMDDGACWSHTCIRIGEIRYLFYEAIGPSGADRDRPYATFGQTTFSQVFCAVAPEGASPSNWTPDTTELPPGLYTVRNIGSNFFLGAKRTKNGDALVQCVGASPVALVHRPHEFHTLAVDDRAIGIANRSRSTGAAAGLAAAMEADEAQHWFLVPLALRAPGHGIYALINRYSGMALEGAQDEGALVRQTAWADIPSQKWALNRTDHPVPSASQDGGD